MKFSEFVTEQNANHELFTPYDTGGGCMALFAELNTLQQYILITDDSGINIPSDDSTSFMVGVYLEGDTVETHLFRTSNVDHLSELITAVYTLWGNA